MKLFTKQITASVFATICAAHTLPAQAGPLENGKAAVEAKNYAQAINHFTPLANAGNGEAQFELAILYISGLLTDGAETGVQDPAIKKQGGDWLRRASDNGVMEAQREMNVLYIIQGYGVTSEEGEKYQRMAADQGDAKSQYFVGLDYRSEKQYALARTWLEKAIYQGYEGAAEALDKLPPALFPKGFSLYKKSASMAGQMPFSIYNRTAPSGSLTKAQAKKISNDASAAYREGQYKLAVSLWEAAAKAGNARAQSNLAIQYVNGIGVDVSKQKAVYWFEQAMAQNYVKAFIHMGVMRSEGILFPKSPQRAFEYYQKASALGSAEGAHDAAGIAQKRGDQTQALALFTLAANRGHDRAQAMLGLIYEKGKGVNVDLKKSMKYYHKSAQQDFPYSVYRVGVNYKTGSGVAKSAVLAKYWLKRGARAGDVVCMASLDVAAQAQVKKELFLILEASAKRGGAPAQHRLATAYKNGEGVKKSKSMAEQYLIKASDQNHSGAMVDLAKTYDYFRTKGEITPKAKALYLRLAKDRLEPEAVVKRALRAYDYGNFKLARNLGQPYADTGNKYAQDMMGRIYDFGLGVSASKQKSAAYFSQAIAQGLAGTGDAGRTNAQYKLGFIYDLNLNEPVQAAAWYKKAANRGHADALYSLAVLYRRGRGVTENKQKAIELFGRATAAGNNNADGYKKITELEIRRDQRIAKQNAQRRNAVRNSRETEDERLDREYQEHRAALAEKQRAAQAAKTRPYAYPKPKRNKWSFRTLLEDVVAKNANNNGYVAPYSYSGSSSSSYGYSSGSNYSSHSSSATRSPYANAAPKPYVNPYTYRYKSAWEISGPKYYD